MSLFLKLQLAIAGVLLLTVAGVLAAYEMAAYRVASERSVSGARTHGVTLAQTLTLEQAAIAGESAALGRLEEQLARLIATGRLMSASVVDAAGRGMASAVVPGLEEFEATRHFDAALLAQIAGGALVEAELHDDALFVAAPLVDRDGTTVGALTLSLPVETLLLDGRSLLLFALVAAGAAVLFGIAIASAIARGLTRPIDELARAAARAGEGDVDLGMIELLARRTDEVGRLARGMLRLIRTLVHVTERTEKVLEERLRQLGGGAGPGPRP